MKIGNPLSFKDIRRYLLPGDTWVEVILSRSFCLGFLEGVLEESTKWSGTGTKTTRILEVHVTLLGATLEVAPSQSVFLHDPREDSEIYV